MLYGLYQSAVGADLQSMRMDTVANNIANAGTASFKRDLAIFAVRQQQAELDGQLHEVPPELREHPGAALIAETVTDFTQGPLQSTGAAFDVAVMGTGFLRVSDGQQEFLTRRGSLTLNADAELVQADTGYHVLDPRGKPIEIPPGMDVQIDEAGVIMAVDPVTRTAQIVGEMDLVQPHDTRTLIKRGESLYEASAGYTDADPQTRIRQGYLEQSGVQPIHEMLAMIETSRAFEANMNLIQYQDQTLGHLLQAVGK